VIRAEAARVKKRGLSFCHVAERVRKVDREEIP
jgi:hypothetical protein